MRFYMATLKNVFDQLSTNGALGDPMGTPAYAYARVSSDEQAGDGKSGLPRQLQNIHEVAKNKGLRITWDCVFFDDASGFEFENRPALSELRREYMLEKRVANFVVMEYLDRLSRNADWHQGYLLDEMKRYGIEPVFWKTFNSRIERAVMGAISQDGMEQAKQRMMEGNLYKARSGRVTARVPAYGYKLVDSHGQEGPAARVDSHYAIYEPEAVVVREIFDMFVINGMSLRAIASKLNGLYPPPKRFSNWEGKMIQLILRRPAYKGAFYAHTVIEKAVKKPNNDALGTYRTVISRVMRPESEWIKVSVPAIVSEDLWDMAQRLLEKNKDTGRRNAKNPYLLMGMIVCAECKHNYVGTSRKELRYYRCSSRSGRIATARERIGCTQLTIREDKLNSAVWSVLLDVLLEPANIAKTLDDQFNDPKNKQAQDRITYLESQIADCSQDDAKLWRAYSAGAFDEFEYATQRKALKQHQITLADELEKQKATILTKERVESQKQFLLDLIDNIRASGLKNDAPFEVKQRIIKTLVDKIILNVAEGWFRIEGVICGEWTIPDESPFNGGGSYTPNNMVRRASASAQEIRYAITYSLASGKSDCNIILNAPTNQPSTPSREYGRSIKSINLT